MKTDLSDVLHPRGYAFERLPVGNVVHQHEPLRAFEKACGQRVKPLLTRCVPNLSRDPRERRMFKEVQAT